MLLSSVCIVGDGGGVFKLKSNTSLNQISKHRVSMLLFLHVSGRVGESYTSAADAAARALRAP